MGTPEDMIEKKSIPLSIPEEFQTKDEQEYFWFFKNMVHKCVTDGRCSGLR